MRKLLLAQHRGSVESLLTILPQIFVFLVMFQLIFMQFNVMRSTHLNQGELANTAITGSGVNYQRYPLVGGGSVLVLEEKSEEEKFIDFGKLASKKIVSIAVDEDENN